MPLRLTNFLFGQKEKMLCDSQMSVAGLLIYCSFGVSKACCGVCGPTPGAC